MNGTRVFEFELIASLSDEKLANLTRELARDLSGRKAKAHVPRQAAKDGERGVGGSIGAIVLEAIEGVGLGAIREIVDNILLLDCCYSGAIEKEFLTRDGSNSELQRAAGEIRGLHIITATTGTQTAREPTSADGGLILGNFTRHVVEGLMTGRADLNTDGKVTVSDLEGYLFGMIRHQTPRKFAHRASGDPWITKVSQATTTTTSGSEPVVTTPLISKFRALATDSFSLGQLVGALATALASFSVVDGHVQSKGLWPIALFISFIIGSAAISSWSTLDIKFKESEWRLLLQAVAFNPAVYVGLMFCAITFFYCTFSGDFTDFNVAAGFTFLQLLPAAFGLGLRSLVRHL